MSSIINAKKDIFTKLSVFSSLKEIQLKPNNSFNSISSVNNSKDIVPFLLDLSTSLVGSDGLENKFGLLFTQFISDYNIKSKELLKKQFIGVNSNLQLPSEFVNNGMEIPVKNLDDLGNLKTSKADPLGELIYDDVSDNFTTKLKNSIISPGVDINYNNIIINYNLNTQNVNIKPTNSTDISTFFGTFIDQSSDLNKKEIVADILNSIYGTKSKTQNKTVSELNNEVEIDFIIDKLINDNEIILSENDMIKISEISDELVKGFNEIDLGCGFIINQLSINDLINISNNISNTNDPNIISQSINNLFIDSLDENTDESNITYLKDSFIKRLINELKNIIIKNILFSSENKLMFILFKSIQNNLVVDYNQSTIDYVIDNYNIANCLVRDIKSIFIEYIFNLVKTEILEITKPALQKIIVEKINNYNIILRSLINR
jgi:hypothetical protein